jgi:ketosteroid isomerase-like protein
VDDLYAINIAKTEFRDAFNTGDMPGLVSVLTPDVVAFSARRPCAFGAGVAETLAAQYRELAEHYRMHLDPIVIEIRIEGSVACDYGWHVWTLTPHASGDPIIRGASAWCLSLNTTTDYVCGRWQECCTRPKERSRTLCSALHTNCACNSQKYVKLPTLAQSSSLAGTALESLLRKPTHAGGRAVCTSAGRSRPLSDGLNLRPAGPEPGK